jgi:hypothetical protein
MTRLRTKLAVLLVSGLAVAGPAWAAEIDVAAKKVAEEPVIDGKVDKVWDSVKATKVTASEGPQGDVEISLKALYTDKDIYLFFQWPDKTMSLNRLFEFDGKEWTKVKGARTASISCGTSGTRSRNSLPRMHGRLPQAGQAGDAQDQRP